MATIDIQQIRRKLRVPLGSLSNLAYGSAISSFKSTKTRFLKDFDSHKVTQEIKEGNSANSSYLPKGNLFSLLGFFEKSTPIDDLRKFLSDNIYLERTPTIKFNGTRVSYNFRVSIPDLKDIERATPLTWDSSKSWVSELEDGVSGFVNYIFYKYFSTPASKSKTGLQSKRINSGEDFSEKIPYMSELLDNFNKEF
jgi:hypothetical protein